MTGRKDDNDLPDIEALRATTAELLNDLTTQIANFRRIVDGALAHAESQSGQERPADVVFVDDLAKCMDCSWAHLDAAGGRPSPDIVAQCCLILETSLQILQQAQQTHSNGTISSAPAA